MKKNHNKSSGSHYTLTAGARTAAVSIAVMLMTGTTSFAGEKSVNDTIAQALKGDWGQFKVNLRYRYENVKQDGLKTATGDPLRLRLGYQTPDFAGFQAYGEFLGNTSIFADNYNSTANGKTEYATIGDPEEAALNQLWLSYGSVPDTLLKGGRQKIAWDNERFICPAAWRQMEQTFDAITLLNSSLGDFSIKATYLWNILTTGNEDVKMNSPLVNLKYDFEEAGALVGYGYWLDYADPNDSGPFEYAYSSQTLGLRFSGSPAVTEDIKLLYEAEYASQSDYQDNPETFSADYYNFSGGILVPAKDSVFTNMTAKIGYEVYGSDNNVSFQTPLGANHKYNGWADLFGKTKPGTGLRDFHGSLSSNIAGIQVDLVYHDFQADAGGSDYGTEFDIKLNYKFSKNYSALVSYATYNADEFKTNTEKFWLQLVMNF